MRDHLGHLNLLADKAIFADSWNEAKNLQTIFLIKKQPKKGNPSKNNNYIPRLFGRGPSQDSLNIGLVVCFCFFGVCLQGPKIFHRVLSW